MKDKTPDTPPLEIHVGKTGSVWVDPVVFFAQPEVQATIKEMKKMKIVGIKLDNEHFSSGNINKQN